MTARPLEWHDLPALHRVRNQFLYLDTAGLLTRGPAIASVGALLSYFGPATGVFTGINLAETATNGTLMGQAFHPAGSSAARLAFLAPASAIASTGLNGLLELLTTQAGENGAFYMLAEVNDNSAAFHALHHAGFAIYARQRIWQLNGDALGDIEETPWRACIERDGWGVRSLYHDIVPGLVQQVEPAPAKRPPGMVYQPSDDIRVYVDIRAGSKGILLQPFIHPDADCVAGRLAHLVLTLPNRRARPIYLLVRSYQSWLEPMMEDIGALPGPRQAVLVKHLTAARRASLPAAIPAIEATQAEPTASIARVEKG